MFTISVVNTIDYFVNNDIAYIVITLYKLYFVTVYINKIIHMTI